MRPKGYAAYIDFDVRTKLLVMLALLSLPLLIISLIQLHSYQRNLNEQEGMFGRLETAAAVSALESWLEDHETLRAEETLPSDAARDLYERLQKYAPPGSGIAMTVINTRGQVVPYPLSSPHVEFGKLPPANKEAQKWGDGIKRLTTIKRAEPFGWSVAVGVPLAQNTPAGRSILMLTATWALTLLASSGLAVWAVGRFTNPLRQLAASASTLGEGQLQERVAVETQDEVGTLAEGFNVMAASLQAKFEEVQAQGSFIEEVLDSLPLGVAVMDASLVVRKANSTFASLVGRDDAALTGRSLYEAAGGLSVMSEVVEDVRRTRRPFINYSLSLELTPRNDEREEDHKFWDVILWPTTERSERSGDLILILSEVSKRVRAEKLATAAFAAEKSRAAELESVIKQMSEGVVIVDARGRYRVNPAAAMILGRAPGEFRDGVQALIADMNLRDLKRNELAPEATPIGRALDHGESVAGEHVMIVRGVQQEERVLELSVTPLVGESGRREGLVAVFHDITEEVRQHSEVVAAYDRLREHDRLKSAFVANVSHELRTPLNVIIGMCQLLERDRQVPLAPLQRDAVTRMGRNALSLLDLVNDLLDYSRLEAGRSALHLENVNVADVIAGVVESYTADAREKGIELRAEVSPDLGNVWTDRHKLSQVLSNLMSNAIKFTASGSIAVTAAPVADDRWYMEVNDTGIGMPGDALGYIFDRFRQVDDQLTRSHSGVGLGLAITRRIVELLEGEITVESKQNEGSRFRITWPRTSRPRTGTGSLLGEGVSDSVSIPSLRVRAG